MLNEKTAKLYIEFDVSDFYPQCTSNGEHYLEPGISHFNWYTNKSNKLSSPLKSGHKRYSLTVDIPIPIVERTSNVGIEEVI